MKFPSKSPIVEFTHSMRSRYGETDRMGYVYYGRYLEYFEVARTEMIRSCGFTYREMEEEGVMLPVIHSEIEYKLPILYDEEFQVKVSVYEMPQIRLQTFYEITSGSTTQVHALGDVTLVFADSHSRKPRRAPASFVQGFQKLIK